MVGNDAHPVFRELLPTPGGEVDLAAAYAHPVGLDRPWVRANMVSSADGGAIGPSGRSRDLSSPADRRVMGVLRGLCDVVLVGANTARVEDYGPVKDRASWAELRGGRPATPPVAVVSRSLDLPGRLLTDAPGHARTIVFTVASAPAARRAHVARHADLVVVDGASVTPAHIVNALAARGLYRVLTEGGPHLLAEFTAAGLLDELCLALSPRLLGAGAPRIVSGGPGTPGAPGHASVQSTPVRIAHLLTADDTLFARYVR
ncbi:Pyrimidine reductase, riboflavin biosynthesis [Nocardiopsis flavescens]|uniref:Pyrimidine reductase, riboflavin biosynthesis n=1 Tax=Nocardiopsis flavescens TaxID=758803 RepID=A0A1M6PKF2_9ACTN|nr:dihydrofolate reductase family protein [Nocardiopsis flavescens]SHK08462.1 Pyrimidine reductase, riboflavin biosynthesis [Nocardiopsis flavescens]